MLSHVLVSVALASASNGPINITCSSPKVQIPTVAQYFPPEPGISNLDSPLCFRPSQHPTRGVIA